jgi:ABC-2 type transport system permease protein
MNQILKPFFSNSRAKEYGMMYQRNFIKEQDMGNMLYQMYAITIKELKMLARDGAALSALFILPIVFVVIMTVAGVGNQGIRPMKILVVNQDKGVVAQRIVERLEKQNKIILQSTLDGVQPTQKQAEDFLMKRGSGIAFVLLFPENFSANFFSDDHNKHEKNAVINFIADPATGGQNLLPAERLIEIEAKNLSGELAALKKAKYTLEKEASSKNLSVMNKNLLTDLQNKFTQNIQDIGIISENKIVFQQIVPQGSATLLRPITAQEQNVPGYTIFGVFFIVQVIGNTLLREKENGTFNRLLIAPIRRSVLLIGKLIPFYIVNLIQVLVLFAFGYFVFHITLGNSLSGLFVVTLATAAAANALGLLIAAISKSAEQMGPLSGVILIVMATIGGILIPYFEMPVSLQKISFLTPQAWALKGYQDILVRGYDLSAVLPTVGALLIFAVLFYVLALFRFRFE